MQTIAGGVERRVFGPSREKCIQIRLLRAQIRECITATATTRARSGAMAAAELLLQEQTAKVAYVPGGSRDVLVTLPDGTTARAVLTMREDMASLN
jgi:hypothetical protein